MSITGAERFKLKKFIKELEDFRGRHTELVSVYVPSGYDLNKVNSQIADEQGTATNIKSKSTRDNVIAALEKMLQHLKLFKQTPPNGLAAFAGNVAEQEGKQDYRVWSIEPPTPLNQRIYRCDKEFILEPLKDMVEIKEVYGMIVMDRRDANIALLKGKIIIPLSKTHSEVPGKFKAGGQSAQRFARERENAALQHYKKVADYAKKEFFENQDLKGLLVGGPGHTKNDFIEQLPDSLRRKVIAIKDLSYTGEFGLQELLQRCEDVLANEDVAKEKKIMQEFFQLLSTNSGKVAYGRGDCMEKLKIGAVETMLISESVDDKDIEEFEKEAEPLGTKVEIISTDTREGTQLKEMGKYAAILRYSVE